MRYIHDNLYSICAALILVIAATCWYGTSTPILPKVRPSVTEAWDQPSPTDNDGKKFIEIINARNLWGIAAVVAPIVPEWHILGIVRNGAERFILLAYEGKPVETLSVGDTLPDGLKIVKIENDRFIIMTPDKKKLAFGIYKHDQAQ